jgi:hypothetical protein
VPWAFILVFNPPCLLQWLNSSNKVALPAILVTVSRVICLPVEPDNILDVGVSCCGCRRKYLMLQRKVIHWLSCHSPDPFGPILYIDSVQCVSGAAYRGPAVLVIVVYSCPDCFSSSGATWMSPSQIFQGVGPSRRLAF